MGKYIVKYEDWSKEDLIKLSELLNGIMTTLDIAYANDSEEQGWLRQFEKDLDKLINEVYDQKNKALVL